MYFWDFTYNTPAENLAADEALLQSAESAALTWLSLHDQLTARKSYTTETLRLWESPRPCVVLGASSKFASEARLSACIANGVPILRRPSGGAAIVAGPGCLMYAVVLSTLCRPELQSIPVAHQYVLGRVAAACDAALAARTGGQELPSGGVAPSTVKIEGISDLTLVGKKFSGNSLRCRRTHLLYHGTLLYDFDLAQIARYLGEPPRTPDYRAGRAHGEFVTNLPTNRAALTAALRRAFAAETELANPPLGLIEELAQEKYSQASWTERL
ncbi:MAG: hypothetical protein SFX18_01245 [Pirellulales bacterium]|nr:hypothetical protein [Pirellulales bacterium]